MIITFNIIQYTNDIQTIAYIVWISIDGIYASICMECSCINLFEFYTCRRIRLYAKSVSFRLRGQHSLCEYTRELFWSSLSLLLRYLLINRWGGLVPISPFFELRHWHHGLFVSDHLPGLQFRVFLRNDGWPPHEPIWLFHGLNCLFRRRLLMRFFKQDVAILLQDIIGQMLWLKHLPLRHAVLNFFIGP